MAKHKPKKHKHRNSASAAPAPRRRASIRRGDPPDPWTIVAAAAGGADHQERRALPAAPRLANAPLVIARRPIIASASCPAPADAIE